MKKLATLIPALVITCSAYAAENPALHGTWSAASVNGRPLVVVFEAGGKGTINGAPMQWGTLAKGLFISQNGQTAMYGFEIKDGNLRVSGGDLQGIATLTPGRAAYDAAAKKQEKDSPKTKATGGGNGQELVGKWCNLAQMSNSSGGSSRMECFELRPDGTYVYNYEGSMSAATGSTASQSSDAGRWSYNGAQLTAQSRSGRTNTYNLEKRNHPKNKRDPMICLNGQCYVTYYNKPAW